MPKGHKDKKETNMKRSIEILFLAAAMVAVAGCSMFDEPGIKESKNAIKLSAGVQYTLISRSATYGILDPGTDVELPISLVRLDESDTNYPTYINPGYSALRANMGLPDTGNDNLRDIEFTDGDAQFYKNAADKIRFLGWYPRGTFESTTEGMTVTNSIDGKTDILLSDETEGSKNNGFPVMKFNHELCQYRVYVYTMSDSLQQHIWGELRNIEFMNQATTCKFTLPNTVEYSGYTQNFSLADNSDLFFEGGTIPVGFANMRLAGLLLSAPQENGVLNMKVTTNLAADLETEISIARDFRAGYSYDIVLRFSDNMYINPEVSINEWQDTNIYVEANQDLSVYYDLSRYGTANSYIVSSANNNYTFLANVMGNGDGSNVGISDPSLDTDGAYVDIIWSESTDSGDLLQLKSHQLSNGYIKFFVPGTLLEDGSGDYDTTKPQLVRKGNVLIGLYDSAAKNKLLWSWHIWVTDKPRTQGYINGYSVLDRNLGATSSKQADGEATYGLYYQWGRKDPLRRTGTIYSASQATIETATENPTTFYNSSASTAPTVESDWATTTSNSRWGYIDNSKEFAKTLYDPCPPGYRVPERRIWSNLEQYESGTTTGLFTIGSLTLWYPGAGYLNNGGWQNDNTAHLYASNAHYATSKALSNLRWNDTDKGVYDTYNRSNAYSVRCISTEVKSIVNNLSKSSTANCYIVSSDGYYKFSVLTRGNGVTTIVNADDIAGGLKAAIDTSKITSIEPLWWQGDLTLASESDRDASKMPIEMISDRPDQDGNATFFIDEFRKGNVIIAAYNGSTIIWTWHIWLTDKPTDIETGTRGSSTSYKMMDRNLGATYSSTDENESWTEAHRLAFYGFYYQWGRKDPFPGPATYNAGTASNTGSSTWYKKEQGSDTWTAQTSITVKSDSAEQTIAYAAEHPLTFMPKNSGDNRWQTSIVQGDDYSGRMWGYASGNAQGNSLLKTLYDPCPPGYHAPTHQNWYYAEINDSQEDSTAKTLTANDPSGNGHYFTYAGWYLPAGKRDGTTGRVANVGTYSYSYSAMPHGGVHSARHMQIGLTSSQQFFTDPTSVGRSMRCQKD